MPRYRIYDAHKLVTSVLSEFSGFVAKADFTVDATVEQIERDHQGHAALFSSLEEILTRIVASGADKEAKLDYGRQFYLEFQCFEAHNLLHQIYEETVIMPELQRLYTDEELSDLTEAYNLYEIVR